MNFKPPTLSELKFSEGTEQALRKDPYLGRKLAGVARDLHQLRLESRQAQAELLPYYTDRESGYKLGTASWFSASKKALEDTQTPAGVVLVAARNILGPGMSAWEPDTVRLELERESVNAPATTYDKLFAAATLTEVPAFYVEVMTFQNTVLAFNHETVDVDVVQEVTPEHLAWGVYEAELILHENMLYEASFDYEPALYTANVLHRAGMVMAPPLLSFAQDALDDLNSNEGVELDAVRAAWDQLPKGDALAARTYAETPTDIQLAKLASVQLYVSAHADKYTQAMRDLSRAP